MPVLSRLRPGWLVGGSLLALVISFATPFAVIAGYAAVLGFQARGAPDTGAISRFAGSGLIAWLSIVGTALGAAIASWVVARRTRPNQLVNCLGVGVVIAAVLLLSIFGRGNAGVSVLRAAEGLAICAGVGFLTRRGSPTATPR